MASQKSIALQLRRLASDVDSQTFICQESGCMTGLLALINSEADIEALIISLQALQFLSTHPNNKEILAKQPGLLIRLATLTEHEHTHIPKITKNILHNLENYINQQQQTPSQPQAQQQQKKKLKHQLNATPKSRYLYTVSFQVNRESHSEDFFTIDERLKLEKSLILIPGIISVSMNKTGGLMLYSKKQDKDIVEPIQIQLKQQFNMEGTLQNQKQTATTSTTTATVASEMDKENLASPATIVTNPQFLQKASSVSTAGITSVSSATSTSSASILSSSSSSSSPSVSSSRALVAHSSFEQNSLQARFQHKQKKVVEVENKQGMVKGLFSSVTAFFW